MLYDDHLMALVPGYYVVGEGPTGGSVPPPGPRSCQGRLKRRMWIAGGCLVHRIWLGVTALFICNMAVEARTIQVGVGVANWCPSGERIIRDVSKYFDVPPGVIRTIVVISSFLQC